MNKVVKRFSSWHGLKKFIAWILSKRSGYTAVTKKTKIFQIALDKLRNGEKEIARQVEEESFRRGIEHHQHPPRGNKLKALGQEIEQYQQTQSRDAQLIVVCRCGHLSGNR